MEWYLPSPTLQHFIYFLTAYNATFRTQIQTLYSYLDYLLIHPPLILFKLPPSKKNQPDIPKSQNHDKARMTLLLPIP